MKAAPGSPLDAWLSGPVICMVCKHHWVAVRPVRTQQLECPHCHQWAGVERFTEVRGRR